MFLKNYTSDVPVNETIRKIESVLIRCGVSGIMKEYLGTSGEIGAITFRVDSATGPLTIRLPANKEKATEALWMDYVGDDKLNAKGDAIEYSPRKRKKRHDFAEQGARTAWKIIQDWIEVQMSMIQMKQAETLEVFLPYIHDGKRTVYQSLKASGFKALLPEKCD